MPSSIEDDQINCSLSDKNPNKPEINKSNIIIIKIYFYIYTNQLIIII